MQVIYENADSEHPAHACAVTIGAFDGVHLGHRAVIAQLRQHARQHDLATAVVTFDRHPASVVRPESAPLLLTDLEQKLELLETCEVDYVYVVHFDNQRSSESAADFVKRVLIDALDTKYVSVGTDFHFGKDRAGNVEMLSAMGELSGFSVFGHQLIGEDGRPSHNSVSSTRIRAALRAGDLPAATTMLGRLHEVRGIVGHGDGRARDLGYRTANVMIGDEICLPADGIYAGWYIGIDGQRRPCAISLGRRPTFYEDAKRSLLEAHLIDFDGDLYGQSAHVQFEYRLRDEMKFDSVDALIEQMGRDVNQCRELLSNN